MAIQTINIGNIVNDGLGDDLRTAFQKVNANFTELNSTLTVTGSSLGTLGEEVFKQKNGNNFEFRKLIAGNKITLTSNAETIVVSTTVSNYLKRIITSVGYIDADTSESFTIQGTDNINVTASGTVITVDTDQDLNKILKVYDFGYIREASDNVVQFNLGAENIDFGTFTNPGSLTMNLGFI